MPLKAKKGIWYGEVVILGYDVCAWHPSKREVQRVLLAEHRKRHADDGYAAKSWADLQNKTEASVRYLLPGIAVWP